MELMNKQTTGNPGVIILQKTTIVQALNHTFQKEAPFQVDDESPDTWIIVNDRSEFIFATPPNPDLSRLLREIVKRVERVQTTAIKKKVDKLRESL
jgi:hypothetical protein